MHKPKPGRNPEEKTLRLNHHEADSLDLEGTAASPMKSEWLCLPCLGLSEQDYGQAEFAMMQRAWGSPATHQVFPMWILYPLVLTCATHLTWLFCIFLYIYKLG